MTEVKNYALPKLKYGLDELSPWLSTDQLAIHYQKHHQAYVNGANAILEKLEAARSEPSDLDIKGVIKEFSFQIGGHILHSLFWENLAPTGKGGGGEPNGNLKILITEQFKGLDRFKKEFTQGAMGVEGSGWMAFVYSQETNRLILGQIEKHNVNIFPNQEIIMVLDMFEHAYYLDYKNEKAKYIEGFWNIINWDEVAARLDKILRVN